MRILFVVHQFYPEYAGGTEKVCFQLARAAQRAGHFVRVLCCRVSQWENEGDELLVDSVYRGIPVSAFRHKDLPPNADIDLPVNTQLSHAVTKMLEQEQYDVAHVMHTMRMGSALEAIMGNRLPYLLSITDFFTQCFRINLIDVNKRLCDGAEGGESCAKKCQVASWTAKQLIVRNAKFRHILFGASERICPSKYVQNKFISEFPDMNFRVIEHGIDLNKAIIQREQHDYSTNETKPLVFGFVGSFVPEKGLECLIEAFQAVRSPGIRLHLYGGFFGRDSYQEKITELVDADDRIELNPFVEADRIYSVLMEFDVFCLPSIVPETYSLVLRESAAAGTPVLVSDFGAQADFVNEHGCGAVLGAGSRKDWSEAIEELIKNPEILNDWKQNLPLPDRLEEEAFYYQSLYRQTILAVS